MVDALKWICEELAAHGRSCSLILCHASERNRVLDNRESCAIVWWEKYEKLPGVGRFDEGPSVVASCLGSDVCSVVWTGMRGTSCGKDRKL
jgi:hypothetical protein